LRELEDCLFSLKPTLSTPMNARVVQILGGDPAVAIGVAAGVVTLRVAVARYALCCCALEASQRNATETFVKDNAKPTRRASDGENISSPQLDS